MRINRHANTFNPITIHLGPADVVFFERIEAEGKRRGATIPENIASAQTRAITLATQKEFTEFVDFITFIRRGTASISLSESAYRLVTALREALFATEAYVGIAEVVAPSPARGKFGATP